MTVLPFIRRADAAPERRTSDSTGVIPAVGSFHCPTGGTGSFYGSYRLDRLLSDGGSVVAVGVFTGELVDARGSRIGLGSRRTKARAGVYISEGTVVAQLDAVEVNLLGFVVSIKSLHLDLQAALSSVDLARELVDGPVTTEPPPAPLLVVPGKELLRRIVNAEATPRGARYRR